LPRHHIHFGIALACAAALVVGGCKNSAEVFTDQNDGGWFSKPMNMFKPDWATASSNRVNLGPQGPAGPEDMVSADGGCAVPTAAPVQANEPSPAAAESPRPPADRAVGSVAGDLAGAPMPAATSTPAASNSDLQRLEPVSGPPAVAGGIALGMTECQVVQRAGNPNNVVISGGEKGERRVVLTYLSGPWPGIYAFRSGRLNVVDRAPEQPKPAAPKKTPKKKPPAKTANREFERSYVQ
jgi:hypothetical protein